MDVLIRPMRSTDIAAAEDVSAEAFLQLERETRRSTDPAPRRRPTQGVTPWCERTAHFLETDPKGCWVAERGDAMIGFATSFRRDLSWFLATYAVLPGHQGAGTGKAILDAALSHSVGCLRGMLAASDDPRALRRYQLAGFSLYPQLYLRGVVDRSAIPVIEHVRDGTPGDFALMDSIDRRLRDAAHGVDHPVLSRLHHLFVRDRSTGSGYVYVDAEGQPVLLAATNRRTATRLLWVALASSTRGSEVTIGHVTAANQWALDVGLAARLPVRTAGYLALRGMKPPTPYLHHGVFL